MTSRSRLSLFLLFTGLGACATTIPAQSFEAPAAAIRAAEETGAARVPEAALRLQLAKEQLERARTMTSSTQQASAERMLMRSQADAELALALTRSTAARAAAQKATGKIHDVQPAVIR